MVLACSVKPYVKGSAPVRGLSASAGVRPVVCHDAGRDLVTADVTLQRFCQLGVQGAPLAEGNQLVSHISC